MLGARESVMKLATPTKEGLLIHARMHAWNMGKEWMSPFQAFRKKLLEGWCPTAVWVSAGAR